MSISYATRSILNSQYICQDDAYLQVEDDIKSGANGVHENPWINDHEVLHPLEERDVDVFVVDDHHVAFNKVHEEGDNKRDYAW